ncbi:uncharacterized protein LOC120341801 [Styela clava]
MFRYSIIVALICIFGVHKGKGNALLEAYCGTSRETIEILVPPENVFYSQAEELCKGIGMEIGNICTVKQHHSLLSQIADMIPEGSMSLRIWTGMKTARNNRILLKTDNPPLPYNVKIGPLDELWSPAFRGSRAEGQHIMFYVSKELSAPGCREGGDSNAEFILFDPSMTADGVLCRAVVDE